ncbi:hypothetical protein TNCV_479651 [Trichonephila clavipes]|nr:hypothetical protein TNCV_479651 [Trichonephila clavipes]
MLVRAHVDQALSMKCVYEGFIHFRESPEMVSDKTRSGKTTTSINDENIVKVRELTKLPNKICATNCYPVFRDDKNVRNTLGMNQNAQQDYGFLYTTMLTLTQLILSDSSWPKCLWGKLKSYHTLS